MRIDFIKKCMKSHFTSFSELGSDQAKRAIFGRKRFVNRRLNAQQVKPGLQYELSIDQRLNRKREEVRQLRLEQQPATKQALLYYFMGEPRYVSPTDCNMSILQSMNWKFEIVTVDYNLPLKEL
jgi:hypothetical protein